jgi:formate dehydrogenase (coenzyme F420) beta subunit
MNSHTLRDEAKRLLSQGEVAGLIGYQKDSAGFRVSPLFARNEGAAEKLFFSPLCTISLVNYLTLEKGALLGKGGSEEKVAIVARGCDSRAITQLIAERGVKREALVVLGVPCRGVVDLPKLEARFPGVQSVAEVTENNGTYLVRFDDETHELPKEELLAESCKHCAHPNPLLYDLLLEEPIATTGAQYPDVEKLDNMALAQREEFWKEEFTRCLRCYACRSACPLCYCDDCILERLSPKWVNRSVAYSENVVFHLARAYHLAGRCAGCGECERVCPVHLPLMLLNRKLERDVKELFAYTAGTDPQQKPLFSSFNPKDPDDFIL